MYRPALPVFQCLAAPVVCQTMPPSPDRADEPVVGIQCSAAAECAVLIGSGCHAVGAFVYVVVGTASFHPFPVVAVAVVIADGPAFSEGIGFEAPTGCCAGFGSVGVLGGRYGSVGGAAAAGNFNEVEVEPF